MAGTRFEKKKTDPAVAVSVPPVERPTVAPSGGPTPGAMGAGPGATTGEVLQPGTIHSSLRAMPLRPETVTPTAPAPVPSKVKGKGRVSRAARSFAPLAPKLVSPPPSMALLEEKIAELMALQGEHPDQDLIGD